MARVPESSGRSDATVNGAAQLSASLARQFTDLLERPLAPALYLVATPIGHLGDISLRALAIIAAVDHLYCEDTRTSRKLLARFGIRRRLLTYHEHNAASIRPDIIEALRADRSVALICDAGTPAISDPGLKLTRAVIAAGSNVITVPGPSAVIAALTASGLATDRFFFAGFLSAKQGARTNEIAALATIPATLIVYESPHRLAAALSDLAAGLGDRPAVVARELTKKFEELRRGHLSELAHWAAGVPARGEITLVIGQPERPGAGDIADSVIAGELRKRLEDNAPSQAAKLVADKLGVAKSRVYAVSLAMKNDSA